MNIYYASLYYNNEHVTGANKRFDEIGKRLLIRYKAKFKCIVTESNRPDWCPIENCLFIPRYSSKLQRIISWFQFSILMNNLPSGVFINDFMPIPFSFFNQKHKHFQLIHDLRNFDEFERGGLGFMTSHFQKWQLLKSKKIITVSNYTANMIHKFCGKTKNDIIVSYNGVDGGVHLSEVPRDIDVLYIATFETRKNHINLLKALEMFKLPLNVVFVGSDLGLKEQIQELAKKISATCGHKISFYEQISSEKLNSIYSSSKIFCSPSLYEGFGMPIIEAYQYGCQVICSDIEVFREVTLNKANYFDPHSPANIFKSLSMALERNVDSCANKSSNEIVNYFSWDEIFERLCVSLSE